MKNKFTRVAAVIAAAAVVGVGLAGCSGSGSSSKSYTFWDPYPQYNSSSDWAKLVQKCGKDAGVTVKRTAFDTTDLTNKALLAGQQHNAPDLLLVDNPVVSTLAASGMLTTNSVSGIETSSDDANLLGAGVIDGKTYGAPIGANTIALYYNADILKAAGVDPTSVKDWASLTAALAKVTASGKKGITFSAIGTEEGAFQFEPWFWGAGANLKKLDSPQAIAALTLWSDWLKKGYAPNSVLNNIQTVAWQQFATGQFGFVENGPWEMSAAKSAGFNFGIISIPAQNGGPAPTPTGGEFLTLPIQKDTARYKVSAKIESCLTSTNNLVRTNTALNYVPPTKASQDALKAQNPSFASWISAVNTAKSRTGDNLGTDYPKISQPLWTAVQNALSGSATPTAALTQAQTAAAAATKK